MAVSSNTVEIRINVTDENSAQTVGQVEKNVESLGSAGAGTGDKVAGGMDKIHGHSLTALDNVRLLRDDIGIRIPRSMEKAIASSKFLMTGINAVGSGLLALGAIDIGIRMVDGLKKAYDEYLSVGKAADDFYAEVAKHRQEDFSDTRSIEDTRARIAQVTDEIKKLDAAQRMIDARGFWLNPHVISDMIEGHDISQAKFDRMRQLDPLTQKGAAQQHDLTLAAIQRDHSSAGLSGAAARDAATGLKLAENKENQSYEAAQDKLLHNTTSSDAGAAKRAIEDATVLQNAKADAAKEERNQARETMRMQAEAREVNLHGDALYMDQRQAALDQLKTKLRDTELSAGEYRRQAAAVGEKFDNERLKRIDQERRETEELRGEAALASFKGIGHTQAEGDLAISKIRSNPDLDDQTKDDRVAVEQMRVHYQMLDEQRSFSDEIDSIVDSSADHQVSGFGRIRTEATKQLDGLQRKFDEVYGQIDRNTPDGAQAYEAGLGRLHRGQEAINSSAGEQTADLARKNSEETEQLESEARAKFLSAERQQTAAIETEYGQRLRKYTEEKDKEGLAQDDFNRRVIAAGELRDAAMVENAKRAREKMAGEFTSFFKNPLEELKSMGEKAAGEAAAAMVQRVQMHVSGSTLPAAQPTGVAGGNLWEELMGRVDGQRGARGAHGPSAHAPASGHIPDLASVKAITLATAEIRIQSANLSFGGGVFAGSPGAGESSFNHSGSTSTSLLAPRSSFTSPEAGTYTAMGHGGGAAGPGTIAASSTGVSTYAGEAGTVAAGDAGTSGSSAVATGIGDVQKGLGLVKQTRDIFGAGTSTTTQAGGFGDSGMPDLANLFGPAKTGAVKGPSNAGMLGGGGFAANAAGAAGGAMGLFSAYEGNGGIGGTLSGAMSGMELGMSVGGPIGAAIGAVGGAILGAIGFGGREKARVYDLKTVRPRLNNDFMAYGTGSMDYSSAYSDMQALDVEARGTLDKMGGSARAYYWDTVNGEIKKAEAKLTAEEKAGRSQVTMSAAQFDQGGWTGDFGSMATGPDSGFAHMKRDEFVVHEQPAAEHAGALEAIRAGASHSDMARYYGGGNDAKMPAETGFGGELHFHVSAIDSRGVEKFFNDNGHRIRASLNGSRAENSGGSDLN